MSMRVAIQRPRTAGSTCAYEVAAAHGRRVRHPDIGDRNLPMANVRLPHQPADEAARQAPASPASMFDACGALAVADDGAEHFNTSPREILEGQTPRNRRPGAS
jgi:hypothetical protein